MLRLTQKQGILYKNPERIGSCRISDKKEGIMQCLLFLYSMGNAYQPHLGYRVILRRYGFYAVHEFLSSKDPEVRSPQGFPHSKGEAVTVGD